MLKISRPTVTTKATLKLEGRLIGPWVEALRDTCEGCLQDGRRMKLDCADVSYADRGGVSLLMKLQARGVELMHCSPFLAEELKAEL